MYILQFLINRSYEVILVQYAGYYLVEKLELLMCKTILKDVIKYFKNTLPKIFSYFLSAEFENKNRISVKEFNFQE